MGIVEERDLNPRRGFGIGVCVSIRKSRSITELISPEHKYIASLERVRLICYGNSRGEEFEPEKRVRNWSMREHTEIAEYNGAHLPRAQIYFLTRKSEAYLLWE